MTKNEATNDSYEAAVFTGREATDRFVDLIARGDRSKPLCWRFINERERSPAVNVDQSYSGMESEFDSLHRKGPYTPYLVINEGGHDKASITTVRAVFVDSDDDIDLADFLDRVHFAPHFVCRRTDTSWHAYWLVTPDFPVERFTEVQRRLSMQYGTDKNVSDLSRVMRAPGFERRRPESKAKAGDTAETRAAPYELFDFTGGVDPEVIDVETSLTFDQITKGLAELPPEPEASISAVKGMPVPFAKVRDALAWIPPIFDEAAARGINRPELSPTYAPGTSIPMNQIPTWIGIALAIRKGELPIIWPKGWDEADKRNALWLLLDDWCSARLWNERTGENIEVPTYRGASELETRVISKHRTGDKTGWGTIYAIADAFGYPDGPGSAMDAFHFDDGAGESANDNASDAGADDDPPGVGAGPEPQFDSASLELRVRKGAEVFSHKPAPLFEIIPDRVEKGIPNFLAGAGGSFKSLYALQEGLKVQAGHYMQPEHAKGRAIYPVSRFVYFSCEDEADEVTRRAQGIAKRLNIDPVAVADFDHIDRHGLNSALVRMKPGGEFDPTPFRDVFCNHLARIPGHKLVVLDSAYNFVRFEHHAKVDEDAVNVFIQQILAGICRDADSTLWIPWHPSQAGQERGDGTGWSTAWHNAARHRDVMKHDRDSGIITIEQPKRNHGARAEPVELIYDRGALVPKSAAQSAPESAAAKAALETGCVLAAIECAEKGMPVKRREHLDAGQLAIFVKHTRRNLRSDDYKGALSEHLARDDSHLEYREGVSKQVAGYFPTGRADDLGRLAKMRKKVEKGEKQAD